jgi:serine protease Do
MVAMLETLTESVPGLAEETAALVGRLRASVVTVRDGGRGGGAGIIWPAPDGGTVIVTNYHVAPGTQAHVETAGGHRFTATVLKNDPERDLAILAAPLAGLPAAAIGDSDRLRPGELVFAVGNPLGLTGAVNVGIVSAPARRAGGEMIRADVSLAPGNSGGLLATADGRVVGVNSMVRMPGLALAVPSNAVTALLTAAERGILGLTLLQIELPAAWQTASTGDAGFLITGVAPDSPAERAGLIVGDVIVGANGDTQGPPSNLGQAFAALRPDDAIELQILRGGEPRTVRVLAGRPQARAA